MLKTRDGQVLGTQVPGAPSGPRILRFREVQAKVGLGRMQIWRLTQDGKFPANIPLGPQAVGWLESEIDAWILARVAERDTRGKADAQAA